MQHVQAYPDGARGLTAAAGVNIVTYMHVMGREGCHEGEYKLYIIYSRCGSGCILCVHTFVTVVLEVTDCRGDFPATVYQYYNTCCEILQLTKCRLEEDKGSF